MAININEGTPGTPLEAALKAQILENADAGFPWAANSGATVTLADAMRGTEVNLTNATPTLEIPTGLTAAGVFYISTVNAATISALSGVTMNGVAGPTTLDLAAYGACTIRVTGTNAVFVPLGGAS